MTLPARRQLGYATGSKKDDKKTTLLAEDVAEALKEVSNGTLWLANLSAQTWLWVACCTRVAAVACMLQRAERLLKQPTT